MMSVSDGWRGKVGERRGILTNRSKMSSRWDSVGNLNNDKLKLNILVFPELIPVNSQKTIPPPFILFKFKGCRRCYGSDSPLTLRSEWIMEKSKPRRKSGILPVNNADALRETAGFLACNWAKFLTFNINLFFRSVKCSCQSLPWICSSKCWSEKCKIKVFLGNTIEIEKGKRKRDDEGAEGPI